MKTNNEYIRLGGVLLVITSVVALLLGFFNSITKDVIAEAKADQKIASMQAVMFEAAEFIPYEGELPEGSSISEVHEGYDAGKNFTGWCFTLVTRGYHGDVTIMTGITPEGVVIGTEIVSHSETPGLGANAASKTWLNQFHGKTAGITTVKNPPQGNQVQAVTSATITSSAVVGAVNEALDFAAVLAEKEAK